MPPLAKPTMFKRQHVIAIVLISLVFLITWQTHSIEAVRSHIAKIGNEEASKDEGPPLVAPPTYLEIQPSTKFKLPPILPKKSAIATFLDGSIDDDDDLENDKYFVAVRILIWQLVHVKETKTKHDVVVIVTPNVSKSRRDRLAKDGAIVHPVEELSFEWIQSVEPRWAKIMAKLRIWQMTNYERILLVDGDTMLRSSLDPIFDDPAAKPLRTKDAKAMNLTLTGTLPETYLLAAGSEVWDSSHDFPPTQGHGLKKYGYFNAGFFMMAPSLAMFDYYISLLNVPGSFDTRYMEQNLLNQVHAWTGKFGHFHVVVITNVYDRTNALERVLVRVEYPVP